MRYKFPKLDDSLNVTKTNPIQEFITYSLGICLVIALIFYASIFIVDLIVPHVSLETEHRIWNSLLKDSAFTQGGKRDAKVIATEKYLQRLLDRIPKNDVMKYDYRVILVNRPEINAVALPSGKIVVYSGLLNILKSENAILFVLGHELGHFAHRDHLRGMGRSLITSTFLMLLFSSDGNLSSFSNLSTHFHLQFSRDQENAADEAGLEALMKTYGHAGGATDFFSYMAKHRHMGFLDKYQSTHPVSQERIAHMKDIIAREKLPVLQTLPKEM